MNPRKKEVDMSSLRCDPWVIYNGFLNTRKFSEHIEWLVRAAKERGVRLLPVPNTALRLIPGDVIPDLPEKILFWDKDVRLASYLEAQNCRLMNSSEAIEVCDDKSRTHLALAKAHLPQPRTLVAPMTYDTVGYTDFFFLDAAGDILGYPMVVKECFGSFGWQVYLAENREALDAIVRRIGAKPFLMQEFIATSRGRDVRLQVVGGQVCAAMLRTGAEGDFRANLTSGGSMQTYRPSSEEIELAIAASQACGTDFAGVDLLFGREGMLVCEVNSNAHFKNICDCTGVNVAGVIMDWFLQSGSEI